MLSILAHLILLLFLCKQKRGKQNSSKKTSIRLPSNIQPVHYLLKLWPSLETPFPFYGYVEIELEVREITSRIRLHMADIKPKNGSIKVRKNYL